MEYPLFKLFLILFAFLSFSNFANETGTLTVDRVITDKLALAFPNDQNIKAKSSDFMLLNCVTMSNELGERWAVVTIINNANGGRMLEHEHLMALFADGTRTTPSTFKVSFEGQEIQSMTISFGENKFPILSITTESK